MLANDNDFDIQTFLTENSEYVDWEKVSISSTFLTEDFVRNNATFINWKTIIENPHFKVSSEFLIEMQLKGYL